MVEHIRVKPENCKACRRCEVACIAAHHNLTFKDAMKRRAEFSPRVRVIKTDDIKTSVRCHHCNPAPCCQICPMHALSQDADGVITMHPELCIACGMCIAACPYGAVSLDPPTTTPPAKDADASNAPALQQRQIAVRCDMCRDWRRENGKAITACMEACPAQALCMVLADGTVLESPKPEKKAPKQVAAE